MNNLSINVPISSFGGVPSENIKNHIPHMKVYFLEMCIFFGREKDEQVLDQAINVIKSLKRVKVIELSSFDKVNFEIIQKEFPTKTFIIRD